MYEETDDPAWNIENHPGRKLLERFDGNFRLWLNRLYEYLWIKRAGYPFAKDDLSLLDWKCLWILECYSTPSPLGGRSYSPNGKPASPTPQEVHIKNNFPS